MIPFLDLRSQYRSIAEDVEAAVLQTMRSGNYILGEPVDRFEENFAAFCGARHCVAVNSGTSALHMALLAAGVGPGDEVITVPSTFVATVAAILYAGATPVLVDIDPVTWTMDPAGIAAAITPKTKAILPVHLHGRLADMEAICAIARQNDLIVIEDAAQAHGATRDGYRAGTFGDIGCFSFYPGKNLGAYGEGGAIVTGSSALADSVRCLSDWGQKGKGNHVLEGFNARMDTVQAAILDVKLPHLEDWTTGRRRVANRYHEELSPEIERPAGPIGDDHACHVYAIRVADRDTVRAQLAAVNIPTAIHYPVPVHLQPAYARLGYARGDFPVAEALADTTLSLPIYPELNDSDLRQILTSVNRYAGETIPVEA
ncbi:dTDP-4-amino-4,6-dideoxygalactose transaminase [Jannaschia faecimaris]|uniref:dTDP-4-amino-4,6-dideoxygalactose transaminase n=1 Tax=Jannaschia faecimaris TaxID=1244108 RepID=A0A1H3J9T9_9RHOB|nr:DegT/DnrJ/EryC1/StrS family aminotransferase [Jannaschia faecimaris]SDY36790.1 dTDP-4-amino-4,6-dideoxygalactose transaminase [Jannaschia faecimaris]